MSEKDLNTPHEKLKIATLERIIIFVLSALLCTGTLILFFRYSRPFKEIDVKRTDRSDVRSMADIRQELSDRSMVNINSADIKELTFIPGIGESLAGRIVEYRKTAGYFNSPEDLLNVKGIGEKNLEKMRPYLKFRDRS